MAAGDTLAVFDALAGVPTQTNYAVFGIRNAQPHLAFSPTTDKMIDFRGVMPSSYSGGGVDVILHWRAAGTSGNVVWTSAFERQADGGIDTDSDDFAAANSITASAPTTSGVLKYTTIAHTNGAQMDSVVAGDVFRLRITRDADNGSDTLAADSQLVSVEIREAV